MKTKFMKMGGLMIAMALLGVASMQSCSKSSGESKSTPTDVTNPLTETVYYVTGVVTSGGSVMSGVAVSSGSLTATTGADGVYSLALSSKANASVSFAKSGYVTVAATAIFESSASAGATVILSQDMTASVATQVAVAGKETILDFAQSSDSEDVTITVPATAISSNVAISATVFTPSLEESVAETVAAAVEGISGTETDEVSTTSTFVALDLQPDGTTFTTPITVSIPIESTSTYFSDVYHVKYNESTGVWAYEGTATLNNGAYDITVDGFSQHGVQTDCDVTLSKSSTVLTTKEYDNIGKTSSMTSTLAYSQIAGWEITGIQSSDLYNDMVKYITNFMGTSKGTTTITASKSVAVSGDEKLSVTVSQSVVTYAFNFDTTDGVKSITVKSYGSVSINTATEQGDLRTDHNY